MTIDLKAIRARADAATEGPWEIDTSPLKGWLTAEITQFVPSAAQRGYPPYVTSKCILHMDAHDEEEIEDGDGWWRNPADAEFIVHARQDIPALLDLADELEIEMLRLRKALQDVADESAVLRDEPLPLAWELRDIARKALSSTPETGLSESGDKGDA